jgi:hypothetical protein
MRSQAVLVMTVILVYSSGCSMFDPPEVRMAKEMNRQMDSMQRMMGELEKGAKAREEGARE